MAFDRHGNLLPSSDGGVAAARSGARSRSRGRSRGRPSRPSSSGPPSTGGQPFPGAPWGFAGSPTKGSRSPPEEATGRGRRVVNAPGSLHSPQERLQSPRSRSRGCRTHSTGRRTTRGLAAVVPQLPFGLGGGGRMDKDGGNNGGNGNGKGPSHRGQSLGGSRDKEGGHTLSRRRVSNGSFHSSAGRRPSEFSESSSSSLQDVPQPSSHGPLHRSGSGQASNRASHGGNKAAGANQNNNNQPKKNHKMILVDEKDRESYRRMAAPGLAGEFELLRNVDWLGSKFAYCFWREGEKFSLGFRRCLLLTLALSSLDVIFQPTASALSAS